VYGKLLSGAGTLLLFRSTRGGSRRLTPHSSLPAADLDRFRTGKSSTHTIAWFLLIVVVALCRKSRRALPIRERNVPSEGVAKRVMPRSIPTAPTTTVGQTLYEFGLTLMPVSFP